jgi:cytidyltransferase-like protein
MTRIVINGSFDVLHMGHIMLFEKAKSYLNSHVYVLADSDRRIQELKGQFRPFNCEYERVGHLFALKNIDAIDVFDSDAELIEFIKSYKPDIMLKGSDYKNKPIVGAEYCKHIVFYDRIEPYSTTQKLQDMRNRGHMLR